MKKLHLFRLLFAAMFVTAATAFTSCSNDDNDDLDIPTLEVAPTELNFDEKGGSQTFTITTTGRWAITGAEEQSEWMGVTPDLTGSGNATITVTVDESSEAHKATLKVTVFTTIFGVEKEVDSKNIEITQTAGGVPPVDEVIWSETCGKDDSAADKPFVAEYTGWDKTGVGSSTVTYSGSNTSVRSSGLENKGSGHNEIFFGGAPATFVVNKITMTAEQTNLQLSFIGSRSVKNGEVYDNTFDKANFKVALSADGTNWTDIEYTTTGGETTPYWVTATSDFTLKEAVSELYIRFTANESSVYRLDDMKLETGLGGTVVDLAGGTPPQPGEVSTISEVIAGENGAYTIEGTVVGVNARSFLVKDDTGIILIYLGWDNTTETPVVSYNATVGQKVKVSGTTTTYSKLKQFSETGLTIEKIADGTYTQPAPTVLDGAGFDAYAAAAPVVKYVQYTGVLTISGFYYNVAVEGTNLQGSLAYPIDGSIDASLNGQEIVVTGYAMGMTNKSTMINTLAITVESGTPSTDPAISKVDPASLSFAAAGESKTVTVTTVNTDDTYTIQAASDNTQFVPTVDGNVITVAAAENTTTAAITGTLTVNLMKGAETVDTKTVSMAQAKATSGDVTTIEADFSVLANYPADFPRENANKTAEVKTFTFGGYEYTFAGSTGNGYYMAYIDKEKTQPYIINGKAGAYIELPSVAGKALTRVTLTTRSGASTNVAVGIYDSSNTAVAGGEAVQWSKTTAPLEYTYDLTGTTAGTKYRVYIDKNPTTGKEYNAQFMSIKMEFN